MALPNPELKNTLVVHFGFELNPDLPYGPDVVPNYHNNVVVLYLQTDVVGLAEVEAGMAAVRKRVVMTHCPNRDYSNFREVPNWVSDLAGLKRVVVFNVI